MRQSDTGPRFDAARVKEVIKTGEWTQGALSRETGIPQGHLSRILSGHIRCPRIDIVMRIAEVLKFNAEDLIREKS